MSDDATKRLHRPTTDTPPGIWGYACYSIRIPYHPDILAVFDFYVSRLNFTSSWFQRNPDNMKPEDIAQLMKRAFLDRRIVNCMIGSVITYITQEPPLHVLPCDGSTFQRADYPELYEVIADDLKISGTEFMTPDLRGRTTIGEGTGFGLSARTFLDEGGEEEVTLDVTQIPSHSHVYTQPTFGIDIESVGVPDPTGVGNPPVPMDTSSIGGGQAHNNMPPFYVVKFGVIAR